MTDRGRALTGLAGVIILAMTSELNDQVSSVAAPDIFGALGISHDQGTWFISFFHTAQIIGMGLSQWLALTFTLRRFAFFIAAMSVGAASLIPLTANLHIILTLRIIEGLSAGFAIPMLITVALRVLSPHIRLYGLAAYALTATCFPNLSTALAGLWTDFVDWRFVFWQAIPLGAIAAALLWVGMPIDKPRYERFKSFDWRGIGLLIVGMGAFSTMLEQGDRLDWFNHPGIWFLSIVSLICLPLFVVNEWSHPVPLMRFQLLRARNFLYGNVMLFAFILTNAASSAIPSSFLTSVAGYRPEQIYPLTLLIAMMQFALLPILAMILNFRRVDSRVVTISGLTLMLGACVGSSFVTSSWNRDNFYLWQFMQGLAAPMIVLPLLMMSTNSLKPSDGPFAAPLVNAPRAIAESMGSWLAQLTYRWRGHLHSDRLTDQLGVERFRLFQGQNPVPQRPPPLLPDGAPRSPDAMVTFKAQLAKQTAVLTISDFYMVMGGIVVAMIMWVLIVPQRTYPPRIIFGEK